MVRKIIPNPAVDQTADDFTQIRGIGPAVENRLHQAGVLHYMQLASMRPRKLADMLNDLVGFTEERIAAQDWIGQAKRLAVEAGYQKDMGAPQEVEEASSKDRVGNSHQRQHYAMFNVKLLLDSANQVRYTEVILAGTKHIATWYGWDPAKLESFFVENAQLQITAPLEIRNVSTETPESLPAPVQATGIQTEPQESSPQPSHLLHGILEIQEVKIVDRRGEKLGTTISADQPFAVWLNLDLSQVQVPPGDDLMYGVDLYLRLEGKHGRQIVSNDKGSFSPENSAAIKIDCPPLSLGDYILEVLVAVWPHSQARSLKNQLVAISEGMRIIVVNRAS